MDEDITFDKEKFKTILHYIIKRCEDNPTVRRTVIYKLLYFSDFNFFELYENKLTGESYKKLPHGPAPTHFSLAVDELIKEGKIIEKSESNCYGGLQYNYFSLKNPIINLKDEELEVVDDVIEKLSHMNATQISDYSHGDMPWRATDDYDIINYAFVFYRDPNYTVRVYDESD
ncbi:Panacea domain-containing protein [Methanobrevibacter ruminantium]|uniref:Panacea domain-containing protein n=1 Tax=Methanobrevibacter ruminantium TaxID=83816 RepID=UPI0026EF7891|nr:Panacea domain-containing protein [Methanobrevibacter ruminantium]